MQQPALPHDTETLANGTRVWTDPAHRVGSDALWLASFCGAKPHWSVCDLGCGGGVLLLSLADAGLRGRMMGVDRDAAGLALLAGAAAENGFDGVQAVGSDWAAFKTPAPFDLVVANPPYFNAGPLSPTPARAVARHQQQGDIGGLCGAAARLLKDGGRFCLCWPPARMAALFAALQASALSPKRMRFVRKNPEAEPSLLLLEARKKGGEGILVLPDMLTTQA